MFVSIINVVNRKAMMITAIFIKSTTVMAFYFISDGYILLAIRMISGFGNICILIYGPIWVDQLAEDKWRYVMLTALSIGEPTGRSMGFIYNYVMGSEYWKEAFLGNGIVFAIVGLLYFSYPRIYFSSKLVAIRGKDGEDKLRPSEARVVSAFNVRYSDMNERDVNIFRKYSIIFTNPVFIFTLIGRVVNLGTNIVLQFWMPNYMQEVIKDKNPLRALACYVFMISFCPCIGSFFGSYAVKYVGGYESKRASVVVIVFDLLACCLFAPVSYMNSWYGFLGCCVCLQLFGSAVVPSLNGIILSSIPGRLKAKGFAIANICSMLFGTIPSPVVYGFINDKMKKFDPRYAFRYFSMYVFFGLCSLIIAAICRYNIEDQKEKEEPFNSSKGEKEINIPSATPGALDDLHIPLTTYAPEADDGEEGKQLETK